MMEQSTPVIEELLLHDQDFPSYYVDMAHPEDYKISNTFKPEFIIHSHRGSNKRLIARVAWKTNEGMVPMSFVCDTGAPSYMYLSEKAIGILEKYGLLLYDDRQTKYVKMHYNSKDTLNSTINKTPEIHKNANILGLKCLEGLNLYLTKDEFRFNNNFVFL